MKSRLITAVVISILLLFVAVGCALSPGQGPGTTTEKGAPKPVEDLLKFVFNDPQYSFQAMRAAAVAPFGGADIGECLSTSYLITEGDDESWYREWLKLAQRIDKKGQDFEATKDTVSAQECYFRASNYYRTAEFFLHANPQDTRILQTWGKSRETFLKAASLSNGLIRPVEIPFEGTTLPGYYCQVDKTGAKRPLLIIHSGFDGTAEELYLANTVPALKRGFNCLLFEGPGQGRVIREQKIFFRYNWETVVTPVVDYAVKLPEVDAGRIALLGISLGGYLAPRAVAFEPRIKVCIPNGGVYDFHANLMRQMPMFTEAMLDNPQACAEIDKTIFGEMKTNPNIRWVFNDGMWKFGAKTPTEWVKATRPWTLKDVVSRIKCQVLVVDSENDKDMPGQAKQLFDALTCPKEFMLFTAEEGAGEHCQIGALVISAERIYGWLQRAL
ncbi:MAG: alpha/beta fold hydrolase [Chloroflexota bacterium]